MNRRSWLSRLLGRKVEGEGATRAESPPTGAAEWEQKGTALYELGRYEEALACYERALEIGPRDTGLWLAKAATLLHLLRYGEALACSERGLEIDPRDSFLWTSKGVALYQLGRTQEAEKCLRQADKLGGG